MLRITRRIQIPDSELAEHFVRASGPGGQNVNKVASAVELRFYARRSPSLPQAVRFRLDSLAGRRAPRQGVIVIRAERFRTQARNRADARARLARLIRRAAIPPKVRIETRPTRASIERPLQATARRAPPQPTRRQRPRPDD